MGREGLKNVIHETNKRRRKKKLAAQFLRYSYRSERGSKCRQKMKREPEIRIVVTVAVNFIRTENLIVSFSIEREEIRVKSAIKTVRTVIVQ